MTLTAKINPEKRKEFVDAMLSLQTTRKSLKGLRESNLYESKERNTFRLVDEWETREDMDMYRQDESYIFLLGALKTLCTEAEIKYGSFNNEKVEFIKNL